MTCPRCEQENPPRAKFCLECGTPLGRVDEGPHSAASYADLQRALNEALERQTATTDILRVISRSPTDTQPVLEAIAENAARLTGAHHGITFLVTDDRLHLGAIHTPGSEPNEAFVRAYPIPLNDDTLATRVAREGVVVNIADTEADPSLPEPQRARARRLGARSLLVVPMVREGRTIGMVVARRREPGAFTETQVQLLRTFAEQAVIAIENVRLFNELHARNRALTEAHAKVTEALDQQTATSEILRVISRSPTDIQPVLDSIAQSAARLCEASDVLIRRVEGDVMRVVAHIGSVPVVESAVTRPISRGSVGGRAILERRTIHIHDVLEPDVGTEYPAGLWTLFPDAPYRTMLVVPLVREDTAIGTIAIRRPEVRPFSDEQIELLKTFADQAVIAIENVRLFKELDERNRALSEALDQQTATSEILRVISGSPTDVEPVFDAIAESSLRLLHGFSVIVWRYDGERLDPTSIRGGLPGSDAEARRILPALGRGTYPWDAILERTVCQIVDVEDESVDPVVRVTARARGWRANLAVPMLQDGQPIGLITVSRAEPGRFSPRDVQLLQTFASQAVIAIQNVRLFKELEARNKDLGETLERQTATADILRAISQAHGDVQRVFEAVADSAMRLFGAWGVVVLRYDGQAFSLAALRGGQPGSLDATAARFATQRPRPDTLLGRTILTRAVQHVADIETDAHCSQFEREFARTRGWRSSVQVPVLSGDEVLGVIGVSRVAAGGFTPAEISLLQTFADQAAIAVQNTRLFTDLQARTDALTRSVEQLTALGEVGQAVSSSLDLETVLTTIVSRAVALTGADDGVVFEYDEGREEFVHRAGTDTDGALAQARRLARIRKGEGVLGRTAITHEPVQVPDIAEEGVYESRLRGTLLESGVRALLAVPMLREGRLLGGLALSRNRPGEFPPQTVALLRAFATQSALAIQNARLYRELADQGRQLEVASRHKSEFLASMSHELRTPLNAILGFNEMILGDIYGDVPTDLREPLTEMQNSGRHLLRLINNVLDLSKIEAGRMELALDDYSVQDTVAQVRASLHSLAADKGLEFVTTVPADIPLAHGDAGRITQCLTNLAGNAIKFTRQGRVEIAVELQGELLVYRVSDTGVGIEPDKIGTLFAEFRQGDATIASEFGGTGLGLSITRKFAEMHGGRVWVESEPGKGSTFFLALPLRVDGGATTR